MNSLFILRHLSFDSTYFVLANILIGMLIMVTIHSLITALRGGERSYLLLGLFFIGALINSMGNIYNTFFLPTIHPYIGSWLMMGSFTLFIEVYLGLPFRRSRIIVGKCIVGLSAILLLFTIALQLRYGKGDIPAIYVMDIITAILLFTLMGFLLYHAFRGNRKSMLLFIFEMAIVLGGITALGVVKLAVLDLGLVPIDFFHGNIVFITGMAINGILFSNILGFDIMGLKVKKALAEERSRELRQLDKAKTDFMMNVSHELRTPLTVIGGMLRQLREGQWGDSIRANRKYFDIIERNSMRLQKEVDSLLQLARMEKKQERFEPVLTDPGLSVKHITGEFSAIAQQKGISLESGGCESVQVPMDIEMFRTAFINLLSNALKFTPSGGRVETGLIRKKNTVEIYVADNGPGVSPEEQQSIFQRFYQGEVDTNHQSQGVGIGLSLVKMVMERHAGQVSLESTPGEGSRFSLQFPFHPSEDGETAPCIPEESSFEVAGHGAQILSKFTEEDRSFEAEAGGHSSREDTIQLLLVEDDHDMLHYLLHEFSPFFPVRSATNGKEALHMMETFSPDVVISDIMMPGMDGYQLLNVMQQDERLRDIPLLFLTARGIEREKVDAYQKGVVGYLEKPFSPEVLIARVRNIVHTNRTFKERYRESFKKAMVDFIETYPENEAVPPSIDFADFCQRAELTKREQEIAHLLRQGKSDKELAATLGLSVKTVGNYNTSIFRKCGFSGRLELLAWAGEAPCSRQHQ